LAAAADGGAEIKDAQKRVNSQGRLVLGPDLRR
jgi:hypothetical protein